MSGSAEMNTARSPPNAAPQFVDRYPPRSRANTGEHPRSHLEPFDSTLQTVHKPDPLFMNQPQRPGIPRPHASYSSAPPQTYNAQLYPPHLQNLAPNSYSGPSPQPGFNHRQGYSPIQVNRVATLPNPLPQQSNGRGPQHPNFGSPPAPAYSAPPPFEFIPTVPHQPPLSNRQNGLPPGQPPPQPDYDPRTSPPPPPFPEDLKPPPPMSPASPTDEAELAMAIELSQKMVLEQKEREENLRRQEEEEFERALAQSMLETTSYESIPPEFSFDDQIASSSKMTLDSPQPMSSTPSPQPIGSTTLPQPAELGRYDKSRIPGYNGASRALSEVAVGKLPASGDNSTVLTASPQIDTSSEGPRLDGDAESVVSRDSGSMLSNFPPHESSTSASPLQIPLSLDSGAGVQDSDSSSSLPNYTSRDSGSSFNRSQTSENSDSPTELAYYDDLPSTPTPGPLEALPPPMDQTFEAAPTNPTVGNQGSANGLGRISPPPPRPASIHVPQATSIVMLASSNSSPPSSYNPQRQETSSTLGLGLERVSSNGSLASSAPSTTAMGRSIPPASAAASAPQVGNVGHYIDPDLLMGISIDFRPPVLQAHVKPMTDPIPNIITLPYGRCPPLHIQAPSWKHLLKLLARMGNTKFEPTVKALSITKTELKLRTVIQFVRIHPASEDWRTILWFTIDHPVPPSLPNAQKYINTHPNTLPWSYTLADLPMLLRNAADAPMSRTYTIPSTESLPYPTLPINFPNLALYLQAALDFSRQAKEDNTGYRKLAKMVQTCYPNTEEPSNEPREKTTVGGMFKRVIGRGNNKKKTGKTNNEETYEYITPFVPDEWG